MFIDPDAGLPFETIAAKVLTNIEKRNPEQHRLAVAIAERTGKTLLEFVEEAYAELADRLLNDPEERTTFLKKLDRQERPFGPDPRLSGGDAC